MKLAIYLILALILISCLNTEGLWTEFIVIIISTMLVGCVLGYIKYKDEEKKNNRGF